MRIAVVINAGAGSVGAARCDERRREILAACAAAGVDATTLASDPAHLAEIARSLAASGRYDAVCAAGGDGTVSAIAGALAGGDVPLAVLPLGTLNHFAKDLGMPTGDLAAAIEVIAGHHVREVDVAELNGRVFVNNSSLGVYPELVLRRDVDRRLTGRGKWSAMLRAALRVLRRFPLLDVAVATRDRRLATRTPCVFVGNNAYALGVPDLGARPALDGGHLGLYLVRATSRLRALWLLARALVQRPDAIDDLEVHAVREARVTTRRRVVRVALDGEVALMRPPLHYRSRPRALRVIAPAPTEATGAPSAEAAS